VFGIIRPCRHRLGGDLGDAWRAHLCGLCLSLRDDHGQAARLATNYDGLIISVLARKPGNAAALTKAGLRPRCCGNCWCCNRECCADGCCEGCAGCCEGCDGCDCSC
jgi:hypothetical protein